MKNKLIVAMVALLLLLSMLVGCVQDQVPAETTETPTEAPTDDATTEETTTLPEESESITEEGSTGYFEMSSIEIVEPNTEKIPDMAIEGDGYDIYTLINGEEWGYRYGCTYLYNDDGSVDAYFACVGLGTGEWDWIAYRHSPDGGKTWENEKIVLTPTDGSLDNLSNCDPGVVYFDGYYYLGYTSTLNKSGTCNNLFVARSQNPDGPFEKWNGEGWGGDDCQPIVYYNEDYASWGIGEVSFVELNGTLYIYYTNTSPSGDYTMVATADARDENWPATIKNHGVACNKNTDSLDVKYVEEWGKFIAVATGDRLMPGSWIGVYESNDGIVFELVDVVREGTYERLHNAGISSRPNGHIRISEDADMLHVVYAYGNGKWGTWNTRVQPISLALTESNDLNAEKMKPCKTDPQNRVDKAPVSERHIAMVRPTKDSYYYTLSDRTFTIELNVFDTYFEKSKLDASAEGVTFTGYDEAVVRIDGRKVTFVGVGSTPVVVEYKGCKFLFYITITEEPVNAGSSSEILKFVPVYDTYTIYLGEATKYNPHLRTRIYWADGKMTEYFCDESSTSVTFTDYDSSIISVDAKGIVTAKKVGETVVTVTCNGKTCKIKVNVTDDVKESYLSVGGNLSNYVVDYTNIDFTIKENASLPFGLASPLAANPKNAALSYDRDEGVLKATATNSTNGDGDTYFTLDYRKGGLKAEDYSKVVITYKVAEGVSDKAVEFQLFYGTGTTQIPTASCQITQSIETDGKYHTLVFDMSDVSGWNGSINFLRLDYFNQSEIGDTMFIKSIWLVK